MPAKRHTYGYSSTYPYIPLADRLASLGSHGNELTSRVVLSNWMTLRLIALRKDGPPSPWQKQFAEICKRPELEHSLNTSSNGPGSRWDRSRRRSNGQQSAQD